MKNGKTTVLYWVLTKSLGGCKWIVIASWVVTHPWICAVQYELRTYLQHEYKNSTLSHLLYCTYKVNQPTTAAFSIPQFRTHVSVVYIFPLKCISWAHEGKIEEVAVLGWFILYYCSYYCNFCIRIFCHCIGKQSPS